MLNAAFFESATILLREGLEAILVLAALGAYLTKVGASDRLNALYAGAGAAIVASIAMAWAFETFNNGVHNDFIEGIVILIAAGLMFYVSGWLFLKQDPRAWQAYLKQHTDQVVAGGTLFAVATLAFLAVFREGAETVLFLHALATSQGGWNAGIIAGIAAAAAVLVVIYFVINNTTRRLPLRPVFLVTSAFLFLMGLKFVGEAFQEFQEQAVIGFHPAPAGDTLVSLGLNASWEAIAAQLAILLIAIAGILTMRRGQATA
jgi:high-affinity iron transporter